MTIRLTVHGESRELPDRSTVADLLQELDIQAARVAVEHNRHVLPRARLAETVLADGDVVEIVQFVGGG